MMVETPVKEKRSKSLKGLVRGFQMSGFSFLRGCVFLVLCHLAVTGLIGGPANQGLVKRD